MSVSNNRLGHSHDEFTTGFRLQYQERALANASVTVLGADAAPVQLLTITTAATIRLPLSAPIGKVFIIKALTGAATITDDAGTPNTVTGSPIAATTSAAFIKIGPAGSGSYQMLLEGAAIA